jgi:hypothetical protein
MSPSPSASLIGTCIERHLGPILRQEGFVKKGRTFYRALEHCILLVNIQGSQWNSVDSARFTLNLAAHFPEGKEKIGGRLPAKLPTINKVPMQARIGVLMPKNQDHWWELSSASEVDRVSGEVLKAWQDFGRPWMDWAAKP